MNETDTFLRLQETEPTVTYQLDPSQSAVEFTIKNLFGLATVRGRFARFNAELQVPDGAPEYARVQATADAASVDTRNKWRDRHLRAKDFFWVDEHPTVRFESTAVRPLTEDRYEVDGLLSVRGVTVPLALRAHATGVDAGRIVLTAEGDTDRHTYGMHSARGMVGSSVHVEIQATFVPQAHA